jgi:membrane-bound serine protease (ClpP class)
VLVPLVIVMGFKLFPKSPFGKRMVAGGLSFASQASLDQRDLALVGQDGTIEADCRPAGMARIDGRRVDVVTRGEWIEAGTRVRVVEVQGNRVVVARREEKA